MGNVHYRKLSKLLNPLLIFILILTIALILILSGYIKKSSSTTNTSSSNSITQVVYFIESQKNCNKEENYNNCQTKKALEIVNKFQFKDILDAYETLQLKNPQNSCHDVMHFIASNEFKKNPNLPDIFNQCTSVCFNACYHGAVLGYIQNSNLAGLDSEQLENIIIHACDTLTNQKQNQKGNCIHGIGHSLMLISDNELPQSLKFCDSFNSTGDRETCYGGIFMENFPNTSSSDHPSKYIKSDNPLYPCDILDDKYLNVCYTFLADYLSFINKYDLDKTISMCALVPIPYRNNCYRTIGSSAQGRVQEFNQMQDICKKVPKDYQDICIKGVVISYADRYGGNREKFLKMFDFCKIVDTPYKKACYNQIGVNLVQWLPQEKQMLCSKAENSEEREWCLNG